MQLGVRKAVSVNPPIKTGNHACLISLSHHNYRCIDKRSIQIMNDFQYLSHWRLRRTSFPEGINDQSCCCKGARLDRAA